MDELTGLEEHLRDEAWECGELAAARREAERELALERAQAEFETAEYLAARGQPCGTGSTCCRGKAWAECVDLPF